MQYQIAINAQTNAKPAGGCLQVDWTEEITCFDTLLRELALFYVPAPAPATSTTPPPPLETVVFPAMRRRLVPTNALTGAVTEVANLKGLYRIFERSC